MSDNPFAGLKLSKVVQGNRLTIGLEGMPILKIVSGPAKNFTIRASDTMGSGSTPRPTPSSTKP